MEEMKWRKQHEAVAQLSDACFLNESCSGSYSPRVVICDNKEGFGIINPQTGSCSVKRVDLKENKPTLPMHSYSGGYDSTKVQCIQQQSDPESVLVVLLCITVFPRITGRIHIATATRRGLLSKFRERTPD